VSARCAWRLRPRWPHADPLSLEEAADQLELGDAAAVAADKAGDVAAAAETVGDVAAPALAEAGARVSAAPKERCQRRS
jgi:hypothetical protein